MTESWVSMAHAYEHGATAHGNIEAVREAVAQRVEFRGGVDCPAHCGSVIAYRVGLPPQDSIAEHLDNPAACRRHPDNRTTRKARGE